MSNMGLYRALDEAGMRYEQTAVGDRFVYENMAQNGYALGGEQSGHIILRKYATTGDGILTALMLMEQMVESKQPLSGLAAPVVMYPQVSRSVRVPDKEAAVSHPAVRAAVEAVTRRLEGRGRILLRKSGTEPVVRIMVESESEAICRACADDVIETMRSHGLTKEGNS
jgi:phosphoglucosamine mutase